MLFPKSYVRRIILKKLICQCLFELTLILFDLRLAYFINRSVEVVVLLCDVIQTGVLRNIKNALAF